MTHFKYLKISKSKKIRFICNIYKNAPFIVFLHGFMSDLEGKKPNAFLKFAKQNKLSFLALEYSGHGKSSGKFTNGNITKWSNETSVLIKKFVKQFSIPIVGRENLYPSISKHFNSLLYFFNNSLFNLK